MLVSKLCLFNFTCMNSQWNPATVSFVSVLLLRHCIVRNGGTVFLLHSAAWRRWYIFSWPRSDLGYYPEVCGQLHRRAANREQLWLVTSCCTDNGCALFLIWGLSSHYQQVFWGVALCMSWERESRKHAPLPPAHTHTRPLTTSPTTKKQSWGSCELVCMHLRAELETNETNGHSVFHRYVGMQAAHPDLSPSVCPEGPMMTAWNALYPGEQYGRIATLAARGW